MPFSDIVIEGEWRGRTLQFRKDRIIAAVQPTIPEIAVNDTLLAAISLISGVTLHAVFPKRRWGIFKLAQGADVVQIALLIDAMANIRFAEPDFVLYAHTTPNDTEYGNQEWPTAINIEEAWSITKGSSDVLLAVFDSGIQIDDAKFSHPDLQDPAHLEVADPDGRYIAQHDGVTNNYVETASDPADGNGHGTWITGILAAMSDNGQGVAGVNWNSRVYIARVLDDSSFPGVDKDTAGTYISVALTAIEDLLEFAASNNIERVVVNLSFGTKDRASVAEVIADMAEEVMNSLELLCTNAEEFELASSTDAAPKVGHCILCCAPEFYETGTTAYADYPSRFAAKYDHVISVGSSDVSLTTEARTIAFPPEDKQPTDPDEVTVVAPGNMTCITTLLESKYGDSGKVGTSFATPMVAGVVSLMWSDNPSLTPAQIKQCLWNTGDSITAWEREYRQLNAGRAVRAATPDITLDTPTLAFVDIPAGDDDVETVSMNVTSCMKLDFRVTAEDFHGSFSTDVDTMSFDPAGGGGVVSGISVKYTAGAAGTTGFGSITIGCDQLPDETWTVYLTANTAGAPAVALVLVADKSGSMSSASGIEELSRMEVLHEALTIAVETLQAGDACAVVSFDSDAAVVKETVEITDTNPTLAERNPLYEAVGGLEPGGGTSIGDGVLAGAKLLVSPGDRSPAILVVTDGFENEPEYIVDVIDDVDVPVFAIGMGTADAVYSDSLEALAGTDGDLVLTGTLQEEMRYEVAKYCVQMLTEAVDDGMIVDPHGMIRPGQNIEIPFWVSSAEKSFDVIVMMPVKGVVKVELVTPDEARVEPGIHGIEFYSGRHTSRVRVKLPREKRGLHDFGKWIARLIVDAEKFDALQKKSEGRRRRSIDAHGIPYCMLVSCRSGVLTRARAYPTSHNPGAKVLLRAVTTRHGQPVKFPPAVTARISMPDGTQTNVRMKRVSAGINEYEFEARMPGVYTCRLRVVGVTANGDRYQREQTVTAQIWNAPRGAIAPRSSKRVR